MPSMKRSGSPRRNRGPVRSRKHTAWRKKRDIGQRYPHRQSPLYIPVGDLPRPPVGETAPLLIENTPHRDFFFPVTGAEVMERIAQLPSRDTEGLTHVWLRRMGPRERRDLPLAQYCWGHWDGRRYAAIVLYPWPQSLRLDLGMDRPNVWWNSFLADQAIEWVCRRGSWHLDLTLNQVRRLYLDSFVLHEVGHHADWRPFSPANHRKSERFANQYAQMWARRLNGLPTPPER